MKSYNLAACDHLPKQDAFTFHIEDRPIMVRACAKCYIGIKEFLMDGHAYTLEIQVAIIAKSHYQDAIQ